MEITKIKMINKGVVVCSFSLRMPKWGIVINELTLFEKNGKKWISFPSRQYEAEGEKKYFPLLMFEQKEHMNKFSEALLPLLRDAMAKQQPPEADNGDLPF